MKKLYDASNTLEAHMILNLLEQQGLSGRVDGDYLQGGIGELPASGLVKVMVEEKDFDAARKLIEQWEAAQPSPAATVVEHRRMGRLRFFAIGLLVGALGMYAYFRTPINADGIDHNRDGTLDEKWTVAPSGRFLTIEVDRNFDGKSDLITYYGPDGTIESVRSDDDFNGTYESVTYYRQGNAYRIEVDTNQDGYKDFISRLENGVLVSSEHIYPSTGYAERIDYFKLGKLVYTEIDRDHDGKMDQRKSYNAQGDVDSVIELNK